MRVHSGRVLEEMRARQHILIFRSACRPRMLGLLEFPSITDAETVIDRQHDEAVSGEILVHRIGVAVVVHVMPAEKHLPRRAAMHENDSGFGAASVLALKQLSMHKRAVGRIEGHGFWSHELSNGKVCGHRARVQRRAM